MESEHWVEAYWTVVDGRKRKYYRLLEEGRHKLQEKREEWKLFKGAVDSVLGRAVRNGTESEGIEPLFE